MSLLFIARRETPSPYKGRSVPLLYTEEADESVFPLNIEETVSLRYIKRTETPSLYTREGVYLFSIERRQTLPL